MAISRSERKMINETLYSFKTDLINGNKIDLNLVDKLKLFIEKIGVPEESDYFKDIAKIKRLSKNEVKNRIEELFDIGVRIYQGKFESKPIKIRVSFDHFVYSRAYDNLSFRINHRFDREGKLDLVQSVLFKDSSGRKIDFNKYIFNIIKTNNKEKSADIFFMPFYVERLLPNNVDSIKKAQTISRFGYAGVNALYEELNHNSSKLSDFISNRKEILPLSKILQDDAAMYLLENTSEKMINMYPIEKGKARVEYFFQN